MMESKTVEMLAGLEGENVTVENIDKYFHKQGVIVKIHVGRIRGNFELTPATLGVNMGSDEVKKFFKDHVKNGSMSFIPLSLEKEFQRIENRIRMAKVRMSIGYENSFMPIEIYKDFAEQVKKARDEYFTTRDTVLAQWDQLKQNFIVNLDFALSEMNPLDKEKIQKAIMSKYPSRHVYADSFYLNTSLKAFPVMANLSLLDDELSDEVKDSALKDNLQMVHEVLGVAFDEAFQAANTIYKAFDRSSKISNKTKGALSNAIKSIKAKNLLKHPSINRLVDDLDTLYHSIDLDDAVELAESILARSFGEAADLNLLGYLDMRDCDLSQADLEVLYQAYAYVA